MDTLQWLPTNITLIFNGKKWLHSHIAIVWQDPPCGHAHAQLMMAIVCLHIVLNRQKSCTMCWSTAHVGHVHSCSHHVHISRTVWFQHILWHFCDYTHDCLCCKHDLIEWTLVLRHSSHRYELVWMGNGPIHIKIIAHGLTDTSLPFLEGHACTKNGVSFKKSWECHVIRVVQFRIWVVIYKIVM